MPNSKEGPNWSKPKYGKEKEEKMAKWPPVETPLNGTDFRPGTGYIPLECSWSGYRSELVGGGCH